MNCFLSKGNRFSYSGFLENFFKFGHSKPELQGPVHDVRPSKRGYIYIETLSKGLYGERHWQHQSSQGLAPRQNPGAAEDRVRRDRYHPV